MEISFTLPKTPEDETRLVKVLTSQGIEESDAQSLLEILRSSGKNKRLRDSIDKHNVQVEKGKMFERMKRCAIKEHLNALLEGIRPKYASCAGKFASQMHFAVPNVNEQAVLATAMRSVNGIASQIRSRKSRLFAHKFTQKLLLKHPVLTEKAIEYLHFNDRFSLVKDDFETIDNFMGLLDLDKVSDPKSRKS